MRCKTGVKSAVLLLTAAVVSTGCTFHLVAEPARLDSARLSRFQGNPGVALLNAQSSTEMVEIGSAGMGRTLEGNLHQWTEATLGLLRAELAREGVAVSDASPKTLKIAISGASLTTGGWGFRCKVQMAVTLGDGHTETVEGSRGGGNFHTVCNNSITDAAFNMITNQTVRDYIAR